MDGLKPWQLEQQAVLRLDALNKALRDQYQVFPVWSVGKYGAVECRLQTTKTVREEIEEYRKQLA